MPASPIGETSRLCTGCPFSRTRIVFAAALAPGGRSTTKPRAGKGSRPTGVRRTPVAEGGRGRGPPRQKLWRRLRAPPQRQGWRGAVSSVAPWAVPVDTVHSRGAVHRRVGRPEYTFRQLESVTGELRHEAGTQARRPE